MRLQKHIRVMNETVEKLSIEDSYKRLFHACRDEETLPSGSVLNEIIDLCRAILFPGYFGKARISRQTIRFHTGMHIETLHSLLSEQIYAGLCLAQSSLQHPACERRDDRAGEWHVDCNRGLPEQRETLTKKAEAAYNGDPAAQNLDEVM